MSEVTRWWWIRHAPVTESDSRIYGQRDVSADCSEAAVFERLADILPTDAVLVTSDLKRTIQTADALADAGWKAAETVREEAFREQHFGEWQGMRHEDFEEVRDGLPHGGWLAPAFERPPDGESFADVVARVTPAIVRLTAGHAESDIVAIAHGGSIRAAIAFALGLGPDAALAFSIETLSLTRLDHIASPVDAGVWRFNQINRPFRD